MPDIESGFLGKHIIYEDTKLPKTKHLGFKGKTYLGPDIEDLDGNPITDPNGLWHGRKVQTYMLHEQPIQFQVNRDDKVWIENEHTVAEARYAEDDRNCWTAAGFINRKAIDTLTEFLNEDIDQESPS